MNNRSAIIVACALALGAATGPALSTSNPIPGVDIIVKKNPSGKIRVGDCQKNGGKLVKQRGEWVCTGLPAPVKQKSEPRK